MINVSDQIHHQRIGIRESPSKRSKKTTKVLTGGIIDEGVMVARMGHSEALIKLANLIAKPLRQSILPFSRAALQTSFDKFFVLFASSDSFTCFRNITQCILLDFCDRTRLKNIVCPADPEYLVNNACSFCGSLTVHT